MNIKNLQFLFKPTYWIMNYPYNKGVDTIINDLLDKYELTNGDQDGGCRYVCKLGTANIWVANIPYAFGRLEGTELEHYRPSRLTIQRLLKRFYLLKGETKDKILDEKINKLRNYYEI